MSNIKVSVIMPAYNVEKYIKESIDSFVAQTIDEKELICVDDGSTDNTIDIVINYSKQYPNIRLFTQENKGAGVARNLGLTHARGEFVAFLDADDFYVDNSALERMYNAAIEDKLKVCAGLIQEYGNDGFRKMDMYREELGEELKKCVNYTEFQTDYYFYCYIYNRNFLKEKKITFPNYRRYQDPPFLVKALYYAERYDVINVELYGYRVGYKEVNYTMEAVNDLFLGLLCNLKFANEHGLEKLFIKTKDRINEDFSKIFLENINSKNKRLLKLLLDADDLVTKFNCKIEPLNYLLESKDIISYDEYLCFQKLKKVLKSEDRVLIYGCGNMGKLCINTLLNNNYGFISAIVDKNRFGEKYEDYEIRNINDIKNFEYDYVLITIVNEKISLDVFGKLEEIGIIKEKILRLCKL